MTIYRLEVETVTRHYVTLPAESTQQAKELAKAGQGEASDILEAETRIVSVTEKAGE